MKKMFKVLCALAIASSFAACKPAACKKLSSCCQAMAAQPGQNPAIGANCGNVGQLNNADQCTSVLTGLRTVAQMTGTVPAACN